MYVIKPRPYRTVDHGDFNTEWAPHEGVSEWWYATGYLHDEDGRLYSYQYTLISLRLPQGRLYGLMLALTDFAQNTHHYSQTTDMSGAHVLLTDTLAQWDDTAGVVKAPHSMKIWANHRDFSFDLDLGYGKGAFWHADDGVLQMGLEGADETTTYFSYTTMPTTGVITLDGRQLKVSGKSWFDKQGGSYSNGNPATHWEWFSLRFYDDEEMMLFSFPQTNNYHDGTFIPRAGAAQRLNTYTLTATDFVTVQGMRFSAGWTLEVPGVKEERYTIKPLTEGQVNLAYFEQLAGIYNQDGKEVGLCFVELLPGVLNADPTAFAGNLFKNI